MIGRVALALALVVVVASSRVALAEPTEAERLYGEGQTAYDEGRYDAALAAWQKSYELSKIPALLFNIAQAHRLRGDCVKAVASYHKFIELDPQSSERPTAEGLLKELEPCPAAKPAPVPPVTKPIATGTQGGGEVVVDGNPGRGKRLVGYAVGGVGAALVVTGVVFGRKASSLADEVKTDCADGCDWNSIKQKDADGRSAEKTQWILLGAGGAALATGAVFYYLGNKERASSSVAVQPRGGGAVVTWSGSF